MDSTELSCISLGVDEEKTKNVLENFTKRVRICSAMGEKSQYIDLINYFQFSESFNLPSLTLSSCGQWTLMWNNLFEILKAPSSNIRKQCLQAIRILSRDKTYLNETITKDQFDCLLDIAAIGTRNLEYSDDLQTEALKILCNLVFQSPKCQELCLSNTAVEGILRRLRTCKEKYVDYNIKFFDMKLLFLITALTPNVRMRVRDDNHGLVYLVESLDLMMKSAKVKEFDQQEVNLINEILKVLFNITVTEPTSIDDDEDQHLQRLAIVLHELLTFNTKEESSIEYHSNIVNLMTNIPIECISELAPQSTGSEEEIFENFNMHSINIFLHFLELKLKKIFESSTAKDYEHLPPILTVMIKCVRCTSAIRRYVRIKILPPLRDVKKRPEEGTTVRNHLCKLLTYPSTQISDLVAELLFVLCKENVGRMIKYTGYGNAAGLFAKRGLLGGRESEGQQQYSSDSEDSDTEEYKQLLHGINPVIGCYEEPKRSPFEGMSDEQVNLRSPEVIY